ncbi:hypothetical protein EYF80_050776 [Liparis tanakae]|uniref:Uncharacterized protein n=1 Tax=Liparis tanakae TaxID=230148 RepID=A0A4Z2FE55_9TELE|nr:hypothetical protein EYF80_050776 [Liparis tanakae]
MDDAFTVYLWQSVIQDPLPPPRSHLSQWLHLKGLAPVCFRKCLVSSSLRAKRHTQPSHEQRYGFSPADIGTGEQVSSSLSPRWTRLRPSGDASPLVSPDRSEPPVRIFPGECSAAAAPVAPDAVIVPVAVVVVPPLHGEPSLPSSGEEGGVLMRLAEPSSSSPPQTPPQTPPPRMSAKAPPGKCSSAGEESSSELSDASLLASEWKPPPPPPSSPPPSMCGSSRLSSSSLTLDEISGSASLLHKMWDKVEMQRNNGGIDEEEEKKRRAGDVTNNIFGTERHCLAPAAPVERLHNGSLFC